MEHMTKDRPKEDYVPAAGRDALLPFYDVFTAVLGVKKVHRTLIDQAELGPGQRVLEIGCGTGNLTIRAKRTGAEVIGSDPDPRALDRARKKGPDVKFERGYAQKLPYPDASFDRVLSSLMFHHLDEDAKEATAAEVSRVLRPGGSLHLVDFVGRSRGVHGFLNRHMGHAEGDIPRLLTAAGLECGEVASDRHVILGQITYYQATKAKVAG